MTPGGDTGRSGRPEGGDRQLAAEAWADDAPRPFLERQLAPPPSGSERPPTDPGGVRPYLLTGGRTTIRPDVNVETIVSVTGNPPTRPLDDEHLALLRLAGEPQAVAELSAVLGIPIGVAMILAGDLAEAGVVRLNDASGDGSGEPAHDAALLRKVVNGVLKLREAESL